jgi:hypothetical protein
MPVSCPSCHKRCLGGDDAWVSCEWCRERFYSLSGGEGHRLPTPPRERPPRPARTYAQAHAPALATISLVCSLGLPTAGDAVASFVPQSGMPLVAMSMSIGAVLGGATGAGALVVGIGAPKLIGALSVAFAVVEAVMVVAALTMF